MKAKELVPLFNELLAELPGFALHKRLLLKSPLGPVLQAINFDPSAFDKVSFYVNVFVMPLCVPSDYVHLTFGHRVYLPREGWKMSLPNLASRLQDAIQEKALPFFAHAGSLLEFADLAAGFQNPHAPKAVAFALARAGEVGRAIATIDALLPKLNRRVAWEQAIATDTTTLRDMLMANPDEAQRYLARWEDETVHNLGLERFR